MELEKEEYQAMINAEIEASVIYKIIKAMSFRAEKLKTKANEQSTGLSIGAQTPKPAIMQED